MDQLIRDVISDPRLADLGLSEQDAQAILWFREQNLYTDLGVRSVPQTFSECVEKLSEQAGFGIRGGDKTKAAIEKGEAGSMSTDPSPSPSAQSEQTDGDSLRASIIQEAKARHPNLTDETARRMMDEFGA